jgi:hypothetical protein
MKYVLYPFPKQLQGDSEVGAAVLKSGIPILDAFNQVLNFRKRSIIPLLSRAAPSKLHA